MKTRPSYIFAVAMIAVLAASGCTGDTEEDPGGVASEPAAPTNSPTWPPPASASPTPDLAALIPPGTALAVRPVSGTSDATIPPFTSAKGEYTLFFVCNGEGTLLIDVPGSDPASYPCNGVFNKTVVYTENSGTQRVGIRTEGTGAWQIAVADGVAS